MKLFDLSTLSRRELLAVVVGTLLFLLLQGSLVGLTTAHWVMVILFVVLYLAHPYTRVLAVALLPFVVFEISYDWMRLYPNYRVNSIDIQGIYETEKALFGITVDGTTMTPCEYFKIHHSAVADIMAGCFYLCWVPLPIAFGLWLFFSGKRNLYLRFALAFLLVNLIGFVGYYIHPAAPPWYALDYGYTPDFTMPGNVAGLGRFDELVGLPVFNSIYVKNANVFAAVPSLHAAYMLVTTIYSVKARCPWPAVLVFAVITVGIWWTAVYSNHHYVIDVLLGIITAIVGVLLLERVLMRIGAMQRFIRRWAAYGVRTVGRAAMLTVLTIVACHLSSAEASAQTIFAETQLSAATGDHTPLWLNANKYGLSSLDKTNGYVRAAISNDVWTDSTRRWDWGYGADVAVAAGYTSTLVVQQAYVEGRWLKGLLTIGSKEHPLQLKNQRLTSGAQTLGVNARPVPSIRLELPEYWNVVGTRQWLGLKGHIAYGIQTDDRWQRHFTGKQNRYTAHTKLHTKAGYVRFGREDSHFTVEAGLELGCQYGGSSYINIADEMKRIENEDGLAGAWHAIIPSGSDHGEGVYKNKGGNHVGSYLMRANLNYPSWQLSFYSDHFFEDHSQMFFIDYDGYGQGEDFNEWKENRWLVYDLRDMMLGVELKLKNVRWLNDIVAEYIYTKYQSGPIYHDRTLHLSDHIGGRDNYYNHRLFSGWQHWGQVIGHPLYRSPLYNDNATIYVENDRFWAWHLALSGTPLDQLHYRVLATWQRGWGTYDSPLLDPQDNICLLAEADYQPYRKGQPSGWGLKAAWALDHGRLLGNNMGMQLTVSRTINLK